MTPQEINQFNDLITQKSLLTNSPKSISLKDAAFDVFVQSLISKNWSAIEALLLDNYLDFNYLPKKYVNKEAYTYAKDASTYGNLNILEYLLKLEAFPDRTLCEFFSIVKKIPHAKKEMTELLRLPASQKYIGLLGWHLAIKSYAEVKGFYNHSIDDVFFKGVFLNKKLKDSSQYEKLISIFPDYIDSLLKSDDFLSLVAKQNSLEEVKSRASENKKLKNEIYDFCILALHDKNFREMPNIGRKVWPVSYLNHKLIPLQKIFYVAPKLMENLALIDAIVKRLSDETKFAPSILTQFKTTLTLYYRFTYFGYVNVTKASAEECMTNVSHALKHNYLIPELLLNSKALAVCNPSLPAITKKKFSSYDIFTLLPQEFVDKIKLEAGLLASPQNKMDILKI